MIVFAAALAAMFGGAPPPVGQALPELHVQVDGLDATIGDISGDADGFYVNLESAVAALTKGEATVLASAGFVSLLVDGVPKVRMRTGLGDVPQATAFDRAGQPVRKIELLGRPNDDGHGGHWIDVGSLARVLGDSAQIDGQTLEFFTPDYWADQLDIPAPARAGLNKRAIGRGLIFGTTPPSEELVVWARPAEHGQGQIYGLSSGTPQPLLGRAITNEVEDDPPTAQAFPEPANPASPLRAITQHLAPRDADPGETTAFGVYACVFAPTMPAEDPLDAIRDGTLKDWVVAGARVRRSKSGYIFRLVTYDPAKGLRRVADENQMSEELLIQLNGFGENPQPVAGQKLLVLSTEKPPVCSIPTGDLYEVKFGDKLDALAAHWGVSPETLLGLNPDLVPGAPLEPGEVITAPKAGAPGAAGGIHRIGEFATLLTTSVLRQTTAAITDGTPLDKGATLQVEYEAPPNFYYVMDTASGKYGYLAKENVAMNNPPANPVPGQPVPASVAPPIASYTQWENGIRDIVSRHLGVRYHFGGDNLTSGIDCSHFVAAMLIRSGITARSVPSPPVINQETFGQPIHWNAAPWRCGRAPFNPPAPHPPSVNVLRPGDRVILQWDPVNDRLGGRHTGIFVGRWLTPHGWIKYGVANAGGHGTTVTDLFTRYFWKGYRYTVRDAFHMVP